MHRALCEQRVDISKRGVTNLLARYDELLAVSLSDNRRLQQKLRACGRVILAVDGLRPDVGHEVLWVVRECVSGEIVCACSLLSSGTADLATLLSEVQTSVDVPVAGGISHGQLPIRNAPGQVWSGCPTNCARWITAEAQAGSEAAVVRDYCVAVRCVQTDDGRPYWRPRVCACMTA
jgi:hypothetical protein